MSVCCHSCPRLPGGLADIFDYSASGLYKTGIQLPVLPVVEHYRLFQAKAKNGSKDTLCCSITVPPHLYIQTYI